MNRVDQLVEILNGSLPGITIEKDGTMLDLWIEAGASPAFTIEVSELHQAYGLHYKNDPDGYGRRPDESFSFDAPDKLVSRINELMYVEVNRPVDIGGPDNCQACFGASGGVKGNENRIDGLVLCDYCDVKASHGVLKSPDAPKDFKAARQHNEYVWSGRKCLTEACAFCAEVPSRE